MSEYPPVGQLGVKWDVLLTYSGLVLIVLMLLLALT